MKTQLAAAAFLIGALSVGESSPPRDTLQKAYTEHQVFALRDAVLRDTAAPLFYRGVLAAAANQVSLASKELREVINASPQSNQAYEAHDVLGNMFFRNGIYQAAFNEMQQALKTNPEAADPKQMLPILTALNHFPPMEVVALRPSALQIKPKSIFLPIHLNGHAAEFFFDTGAGLSLVGESEAKQLGLSTQSVSGTMGDASGNGVSGLRVALAKDLTIGGLHMRNVPFVVISDSGEPWRTMPTQQRGIIGIPVLLAMRAIQWRTTGSFAIDVPGPAPNLATSNLLFHNSNPVVDIVASGKHLDFTLDTGAVTTDLNPAFAQALPALMKSGTPEKQSIEGLGGATEGASVLLPSVTLEVGQVTTVLKPAHVFTEHGNGSWAAGNLGMDVLSQAPAFTLDFKAMTLQLQASRP